MKKVFGEKVNTILWERKMEKQSCWLKTIEDNIRNLTMKSEQATMVFTMKK